MLFLLGFKQQKLIDKGLETKCDLVLAGQKNPNEKLITYFKARGTVAFRVMDLNVKLFTIQTELRQQNSISNQKG